MARFFLLRIISVVVSVRLRIMETINPLRVKNKFKRVEGPWFVLVTENHFGLSCVLD